MSVASEVHKFGEDEIEVANILVDMRRLMAKFVCCYSFKYNWIVPKKRRSALVSPQKRKLTTPLCKEEASSPNTPFCFSVSESDSNPDKTSSPLLLREKKLKKTSKEINRTQHQIKKSIESVQKYLDPIMAENSGLKAKKRELQMGGKEKKLKATVTADSTLYIQQTSSTPLIHLHCHIDGVDDSGPSTSSQFEHQPPPLIHQYPYRSHHGPMLGNDPMYAGQSSSTLFHHQQSSFLHLAYPMLQKNSSQQREAATLRIDLNVSASPDDEIQMNAVRNMIVRRAQAYEARKNRKRVISQKKTRATT